MVEEETQQYQENLDKKWTVFFISSITQIGKWRWYKKKPSSIKKILIENGHSIFYKQHHSNWEMKYKLRLMGIFKAIRRQNNWPYLLFLPNMKLCGHYAINCLLILFIIAREQD